MLTASGMGNLPRFSGFAGTGAEKTAGNPGVTAGETVAFLRFPKAFHSGKKAVGMQANENRMCDNTSRPGCNGSARGPAPFIGSGVLE